MDNISLHSSTGGIDGGSGGSGARRNESSRPPSSNTENFSFMDGYNLKDDPRYQILCSNKRKTLTFQSFAPFHDDEEDRIQRQLKKMLEFDFQRRTPLRKSHSIEDFAKAFQKPMCMFRH